MSLLPSVPLTPPATRSRKENVRPSPSSPCGSPRTSPNRRGIATPISPFRPSSRVNFAPHKNSHYPHSPKEPPRCLPSSRLWGRPSRSILKRPSLTNLMPPAENQLRQVTPEPDGVDALTQESYTVSPLKVIVTSVVDDSLRLRDVTEAWTLLFARLRARFPSELTVVPALNPLKANISALLEAIHRDVKRALVDPLQNRRVMEQGVNSTDPAEPKKRGGMTEFEVTFARDLFMLSNAALRFLSLICWVPQLYECLNDEQLKGLMDTVLCILDADTLPTNTPRKTYGLALAILQVQRLPESILSPFTERISSAIRRGLDGEYGREGKKGPTWESLGALQTIADGEITAFHGYLPDLFVSLLPHLISPASPSLRLKAAFALGALGNYAVSHRIEELVMPVIKASTALAPVLEIAFQKGGSEGAWGITVLASVVALTGHRFHLSRKWMKTFMLCSQTGLNMKKDVGMKLASRVLWCSLLWAWDDGHSRGIEGFQANDDSGLMVRQARRTQQGGISTVAQAPLLQRPIGISLVATFIGDGSDQEAVTTGIAVLHEMILNHSPLNVDLLFRLLALFVTTGDERIDLKDGELDVPWKSSKLLCTSILNGTLIANTDVNSFVQVAKSLLLDDIGSCIRLADVRPFDADEVTMHWDVLMRCWDAMFKQGLTLSNSSVQATCRRLWIALIKARVSAATTLLERKSFSRSMVDRIAFFLEQSPYEWAPESALSLGTSQCSISAASSLFIALVQEADILSPSFTIDLLERVVKVNVDLSTPEVKKMWREFIVNVVRVGLENSTYFEILRSRVLAENQARSASLSCPAVHKAAWGSVWDCTVFIATQPASLELNIKWEDVASLTHCVPFSDPDPNIEWSIMEARWSAIIHAAVERCDMIGVSRASVIKSVVPCISHQRIGLRGAVKALCILFSLLENNEKPMRTHTEDEENKLRGLYDLFNELLGRDAPMTIPLAADDTRTLDAVLDCISCIEKVVRTTPPNFVVSRLCNLEPGLLPWLRDESKMLTDSQYNDVIASFYVVSLQALLDVEPTTATLSKIAVFLVSGFVRLPPPLLCPNAFESFWTAMYKPITAQLVAEGYQYPEELKVCLRYFIYSGAECESFAVGLSAGIESTDKTNEDSFVPESVNNTAPTRQIVNQPLAIVASSSVPALGEAEMKGRGIVPTLEHKILVPNSSSSEDQDDPDMARIISADELPSTDVRGKSRTDLPVINPPNSPAYISASASLSERPPFWSSSEHLCDEEAEEESIAASLVEEVPSTPHSQRVESVQESSSKRKRVSSVYSEARKKHKPRVHTAVDSFVVSLVRGTIGASPIITDVKSISEREAHSTKSQEKPHSECGRALTSDATIPPNSTHRYTSGSQCDRVEVEVPTLLQAWKPEKARSMSISSRASPSSAPTEQRNLKPLKRTRPTSTLQGDEGLPSTSVEKVGPPKRKRRKPAEGTSSEPRTLRSGKIITYAKRSSSEVISSPFRASEIGHACSTAHALTDTPEFRGPVLPALGDTVISPELKRNEPSDNPSSDDSTQQGSSPIRNHVQRRLSRNNSSGLLSSKPRLNVLPLPTSDGIKDAAQVLAAMTKEQLTTLSAEDLLHLRVLIDGLGGKVDNALASKGGPQ